MTDHAGVTGRKSGGQSKKTPKTPKPTTDRDAYSVEEFCRRHNISRGTYYNLRTADKGPVEARVFNRVLITKESAEAWRRAREQITEDESAA
jgi:hypothetical protein